MRRNSTARALELQAAAAIILANAAYVSDVTIPDGTEVAPGQTFTKSWELLNTGTCTWSEKHAIFFAGGDNMEGPATTIHHSVAPGESVDVSVELTAPDEVEAIWATG